MSTSINSPILVIGATGKQGGAVVRALLQAGRQVHALTRDPASAAAQALAGQGVRLFEGDLNDTASLDAALTGVDGVFSVQLGSPPEKPELELQQGKALVEAAHRANVRIFVQTSVARAGDQKNFVDWETGRWVPNYWNNKAAVNEMAKTQGFPFWVILKPALIMENLLPPMVDALYPTLAKNGRFETGNRPDTLLDWIAAQDIGAFAAAAFADPERFHGHEISLASESVTLPEVAKKLTKATGKQVTSISFTEQEQLARGIHPMFAATEEWNNVEGYKVDLKAARSWGLPLTTLDQFIEQNRDKFVIG